ncbi:MAG: hypothetical protein HKN24_12115 [Acidimicrobiales bacterium]|nr:hypothetical protein [Acidimicrobiales bacterium]
MISDDNARRGRLVVAGIMFFNPVAGVVFQALHYLIGLRRLGFDVYYVEDTDWWSLDPRDGSFSPDPSASIELVAPVLERHGFADKWAYRRVRAPDDPRGCWGMSDGTVLDLYRSADAWLNVTGSQTVSDDVAQCARRILIESDPISAQIDVANRDRKAIAHLDAHDTHFTFGETLDNPACRIPLGPYDWQPTRQPVALELWPNDAAPSHTRFTTITSWHDDNKDREYQGETYRWTKDAEFLRVVDIGCARPNRFEMAVTGRIDRDAEYLNRAGWTLQDALVLSSNLGHYQSFITESFGEFTVAREQYTKTRTGWFSDRSACYLASGRPVITQETGFSDVLPTGSGLYAWNTTEEILDAVDRIDSDPETVRHDAHEIAREYFATDRVLADLIGRARL